MSHAIGGSEPHSLEPIAPLNSNIPPLPENATPEEKDEHWLRYVYQGDRMPQLTLRAVLIGGVLGMLMSASNLYTTLSIGWAFGVAITACVMSYVLWGVLRLCSGRRVELFLGCIGLLLLAHALYTTGAIGGGAALCIGVFAVGLYAWLRKRLPKMSILENNCMQSTASAAGYSTGSTLATMFGAMLLLQDPAAGQTSADIKTWAIQPMWVVIMFTMCTGLMGVFLAVPMKKQMINHEQLRFPSGVAAAETLKSLYSESVEALQKAYSLILGIFFGAMVGILNTGEGTLKFLDEFFGKVSLYLFDPRLPEQVPANGFVRVEGGSLVGWGASLQDKAVDAAHAAVPAAASAPVVKELVWNTSIPNAPGKIAQAFGFEPSVLLIAAGVITGMRVCLSMFIGSILLYLVVGPYLVGVDVQSAGSGWSQVDGRWMFNLANKSEEYKLNIPLNGAGTVLRFTTWALWGGTAVMVFASLTAVALQWRTISRAFLSLRTARNERSSDAIRAIEVPTSWMVAGMIPLTIAMLFVQMVAFNISWWAGLLAVAMSFFLVLVACRATGETDTTPIGAMGKVMQLLFAAIQPGKMGANLAAAGIAANSASSSADLLTDLKSGYLLGANPRKQFLAQFIGVFFGTLAIVPIWYLMVPDKAHLEKFAAPATRQWEAVARVLIKGVNELPHSAIIAIVIGAAIGIALPIIERFTPARYRKYLPSAMGLGLSWVIPFSSSLGFLIGAVIAWLWELIHRKSSDKIAIALASGLIAGESLVKAVIAMTATAIGLGLLGAG